MKKLMMAAAIVCAAVAAQAGSANWSVLDVATPNAGYAYLFNSADIAAASIDAVLASISDGTFATAYAAKAVNEDVIEEGELYVSKAYTGSGNTDFWMIAVDDASDPTMAFVGEEITVSLPSTSATKPAEWVYGENTTAWQSVPEPTSGLLLLLGVAGLALRRRRA